MVGLQYLAQCLVGRKYLINECMTALLAWCSTHFYQKNKIANLILVTHLVRDFSVLNKNEGKIIINCIFKSVLFSKSQDRPLPFYICPSTLSFTANFPLVLFLLSYFTIII